LRYLAVIVKVENVHTRTKNKYNEEERIDLKKDTKYRVDLDKAKQLLTPCYDKLLDSTLKSHLTERDHFEFWGKADDIKKIDPQVNDEVIFRTIGNSIFLFSLLKTTTGQFSHMKGGEVLNQISKISDNMKRDSKLPQDKNEGVDESEWN